MQAVKERELRMHGSYFRLTVQRKESEQHQFWRGTLRPSRAASPKRKVVSLPFWAFNWRRQWNTHLETSWSQLELTGAQERGKGWKYKSTRISPEKGCEPWQEGESRAGLCANPQKVLYDSYMGGGVLSKTTGVRTRKFWGHGFVRRVGSWRGAGELIGWELGATEEAL